VSSCLTSFIISVSLSPVPDGSLADIVTLLQRGVEVVEVNEALQQASERGELRNILRVTDEALVSQDSPSHSTG